MSRWVRYEGPSDDRDHLTGLPRAGAFQARLDAVDRAAREQLARTENAGLDPDSALRGWYAVAIIDIVGLREINRDHGLAAGDIVLQVTATRLKNRTRDAYVARVGGDEFAVLVPHIDRGQAGQFTRALKHTVLGEPIHVGNATLDVKYRRTARCGPVMGDPAVDAEWPPGSNMLWRVQYAAAEDASLATRERMKALERMYADLTSMGFDETLSLRDRLRTAERLAARDPLTDLQNRRAMRDRLDDVTDGGVLAFVDVDDLRALNGDDDEAWGAGDRALTSIARLLQDEFGEFNVARWGGDEYLILVADTTEARLVAARLRGLLETCKREIVVAGKPVSFSAGVAMFSEPSRAKQALGVAHKLTKKAKHTKATVVDDPDS